MPWLLAAIGAGALYLLVRSSDETTDPLDRGINPDIRVAVTFAYLYEKDPSSLYAFAQSLMPDLPVSAHLLARKSGQSVSGHPYRGQTVGNIIEDFVDTAGDVGSSALDVLTHPADTASGAWGAITHPGDSMRDFGNALVDALHAIPGMDEAGELLKDFSRTAFGEWCLRVLATVGYYVMAPYLGAQLAAVSFALPGVAKGSPFLQSWITETIDRVIKTINILLQQEGLRNVGSATSEAVNKILASNPLVQALAKEFTEQIGKATSVLTDRLGAEIAAKLKSGASDALDAVTRKLAAEYGYPPDFAKLAREAGVREDNAAAAYDLLAQTHYQTTTAWDPITGEDIAAHLFRARFQAVDTGGIYASTSVYRDPRTLSAGELDGRRAVSISEILNKPARRFWVDFYVNRARYAHAGVAASAYVQTHAAELYGAPAPPAGGFSEAPATGPIAGPATVYASGGFSSGLTFQR